MCHAVLFYYNLIEHAFRPKIRKQRNLDEGKNVQRYFTATYMYNTARKRDKESFYVQQK